MAKRISSIFSMSSNYSDQSSDSRYGSSLHPARPSKEQNSVATPHKSMPNLRPISNLQDPQITQSSAPPPPFNTTIPPRIDLDERMLQPSEYPPSFPLRSSSRPSSIAGMPSNTDELLFPPPPLLKPLPGRSESPTGSRPVSRGSGPESLPSSRPPSRPGSRPASPNTSRPQTPTTDQRLKKKKSWLPGKSHAGSRGGEDTAQMSQAWAVTPQQKIPYDVNPLANFHRVPELWNECGDTFVYLHARECGRGPSLKVDSAIFASSKKLIHAAYGGTQENNRRRSSDWQQRSFSDRMQHLTVNGPTSPPTSRPGSSYGGSSKGSRSASDYLDDPSIRRDIHLCLPMPLQVDLSNAQARPNAEDVEILITIRNTFAFLLGQPLVATNKQSSMFAMLLKIADVLQRYEFTNLDGSTLGEEAAGSFTRYVEDFKLADVRASREKTIESVVLGERMRSWDLYNEGFVHLVGKYDDVWAMKSPKFHLISDVTRKRMERAHLDLSTRLRNVQTRLEDFDFPSLFAGFANSTSSSESKVIRFKDWKSSYMSMRRHVMSLYKHQYGAWPPKAKSKKNDFEESGLNRLLLQELYQDFSDLYDTLVDRSSLTSRSTGLTSPGGFEDQQEPMPRALRRILDEYDLSTAPVQPPIPFDLPQLPSLSSIRRRNFDALDPHKQKKERSKRLPDDEINAALLQSCNRDSLKSTPFLEAFLAYERRSAHGKSMEEICDLRIGQWIFMYAVIQSLPLVVVDAPGIKWSQGVEYFLCEVPKGSAPWITAESVSVKQSWYGIAGGSGLVSLPADVVEHGVDGIYRRSHCWQAAEKWAGYGAIPNVPQPGLPSKELLPPVMPSRPGSRGASPSPDRRASMALGLEQLPLPPGVAPSGARPVSVYDPSKTFGAILGQGNTGGKKK